jgi:sigma-B regulation protein RsbU (phosphoserine phosphatase)
MPEAPPADPELRYHLLLDLARRVSRTLDLQEILTDLLKSLRAAIPYDAAGVFVLNRSLSGLGSSGSNLIAGMAQVGFDAMRADDPMLRWGHGIVGHVIRTGETVLAPDVAADPRYVSGRAATRSELAVPMVGSSGVVGALNVESDRAAAFSATDAELLEFFANAAALAIEKALLHRELLQKQWMDGQLKLAREVQAGLLPRVPPELAGYDLAGSNLPTWTIGGDYYDWIPLDDGRMGLVVADVSGKGIPAALIMATFRAALRAELRRGTAVTGAVSAVNRVLLESQGGSRFVTAVCGALDPASGRLEYVNCGHNPPLLLRAGGAHEALDSGGPALGLGIGGGFTPGEASLEPGDLLALYTDGVVEPASAEQEEFGLARLLEVLRRNATRPASDVVLAVVEATRRFSRRESYDDDFTMVVVKRGSGLGGLGGAPDPLWRA